MVLLLLLFVLTDEQLMWAARKGRAELVAC